MTEKRTPAEQLAHERQMVLQAGNALVTTGHLILSSVSLNNFMLLDWPQTRAYVNEQVQWAIDVLGLDEEHDV